MITRQYAAWLAMEAIYADDKRASQFDQLLNVGNDVVGILTVNDTLTITPEGTYNGKGWLEDFDWLPAFSHPIWGDVHQDFYDALLAIYQAVKPLALDAITKGHDVFIQGHSRAGTLADALASHCALDGIKTNLSTFEAANFGCQQYSDWANRMVASGLINVLTCTRNGLDPVPSLPPPPWVRTYPKTDLELNAPPGGLEDILPLSWHMSATVYPAYSKIYPQLEFTP